MLVPNIFSCITIPYACTLSAENSCTFSAKNAAHFQQRMHAHFQQRMQHTFSQECMQTFSQECMHYFSQECMHIFSQECSKHGLCGYSNMDCGYTNEYPQSMFWSKNKKNRYTPAYPLFCYIKVGIKGASIARTCFPDA